MFTTDNNSIFRTLVSAVGTLVSAVGTLVLAGTCLVAAAGPVNAAEAPRVQVIGYSDLNLSTPSGRNALESRIQAAARNVCTTGMDGAGPRIAEARCVRNAINSAKRTVATVAPGYQG